MEQHRAGFWIRFIAFFIDSIILGIVQYIVGFIIPVYDMTATSIISLIITFLYFVWFQSANNGQTLGKKITGIRVANLDGGRVSIGKMLLREMIGKILSSLILFIGYLIAAGKQKRALHDYIAQTIVIRAE
ncbi:RDD family protein [Bacillus sp. HMF5848]|uniref:RDD family protein n=1 Tax=Bacillus sp. HMF5848 TaxID=2495421 RepID=UPI000F7A8D80|nr:RDD family protein [Bacillus sp. HMF5848]RSK27666.1 RDD family protein [Bacillus sp. HMF5848]